MKKKIYISPEIELIALDNDIALALQSDLVPPEGPFETIGMMTPDYFSNNHINNSKA